LIDKTTVPGLSTKTTNVIKVVGDGSHFLFFINDELMGEVEDDHIFSGQVGLAASLPKGSQATFTFDNFDLNAP
jgi:hypothetical protein